MCACSASGWLRRKSLAVLAFLPFFHALCEEAKPIVAKITQMGAKHELMAGPLTDFMIAGYVTLDQLTGNAT